MLTVVLQGDGAKINLLPQDSPRWCLWLALCLPLQHLLGPWPRCSMTRQCISEERDEIVRTNGSPRARGIDQPRVKGKAEGREAGCRHGELSCWLLL